MRGDVMPLTRGRVVGYNDGDRIFRFTMMTSNAKQIECQISSTAMDFIARKRGTSPSERKAQFLQYRNEIEQLASDLFDKQNAESIRIFTKHLGKRLNKNRRHNKNRRTKEPHWSRQKLARDR
jgi:hypothetical protein